MMVCDSVGDSNDVDRLLCGGAGHAGLLLLVVKKNLKKMSYEGNDWPYFSSGTASPKPTDLF